MTTLKFHRRTDAAGNSPAQNRQEQTKGFGARTRAFQRAARFRRTFSIYENEKEREDEGGMRQQESRKIVVDAAPDIAVYSVATPLSVRPQTIFEIVADICAAGVHAKGPAVHASQKHNRLLKTLNVLKWAGLAASIAVTCWGVSQVVEEPTVQGYAWAFGEITGHSRVPAILYAPTVALWAAAYTVKNGVGKTWEKIKEMTGIGACKTSDTAGDSG